MALASRNIIVGVSGGIAAFKSVLLVRELMRQGANVQVVMTPSAARFVGPLTFSGITGRPCLTDLWDDAVHGEVHVELAAWADAFVLAPATMNAMARLAAGMADDLVLATLACFEKPIVIAPAMHTRMWHQEANQRNVDILRERGATLVGPVEGPLASGETGMGRMSEPEVIVQSLVERLDVSRNDLRELRVLISAGPTLEDIDPVRFIGNRSSGRMGFALAERAAIRGAEVVLVAGPVQLATPRGVQRVDVRSALEMRDAMVERATSMDAVIMAAAVGDYRPSIRHDVKLKKSSDDLAIALVKNPDILSELGASRTGPTPVLIGFAVETHDLLEYARRKLAEKNVDLIVANEAADGFGGTTNRVVLVERTSEAPLPTMSKQKLSDRILDRVGELCIASRVTKL